MAQNDVVAVEVHFLLLCLLVEISLRITWALPVQGSSPSQLSIVFQTFSHVGYSGDTKTIHFAGARSSVKAPFT
jgi:hypothetical protein